VFTPVFDLAKAGTVEMEDVAEYATAGNLEYVEHPNRPSVRTFFQTYSDRTMLINGLLVRSVAHTACTKIALTGSTNYDNPDWATILGSKWADRVPMPHMVVMGPGFPGNLGRHMARTGYNWQLHYMLDETAYSSNDIPTTGIAMTGQASVDEYLMKQAQEHLQNSQSTHSQELSEAYAASIASVSELKLRQEDLGHDDDTSFVGQINNGINALAGGFCRCVTLAYPEYDSLATWDSHSSNELTQSHMFEQLFSGLVTLNRLLDDTPGEIGATLADETVVVIISEMGRAPLLNSQSGKDHWAYTSALLWGPGVQQDRQVGGHDEQFLGLGLDLDSADVEDGGEAPSIESFGGALLALGGVDPGEHLEVAEPMLGILD